jgi:hypothetical protein
VFPIFRGGTQAVIVVVGTVVTAARLAEARWRSPGE